MKVRWRLAVATAVCCMGAHAFSATGAAAAEPAAELEEIKVTARAMPVQTLIDRTVYALGSNLQAVTGSAADVLNTIPSVDVDADGNVTLRGDAHVLILVDGRPSAQFSGSQAGDGLQQFAASDIDRIEIMTSPPAEFRAEASGGVINIITRKRRARGPSESLQASVGNRRRYVLGANVTENFGSLKLSGGAGLRQDDRQRDTISDRVAATPISGTLVRSHEDIAEHLRRLSPSLKAGVEYAPDERRSLEATFSHRELSGDRFFDQHNDSGNPAAAPASITTRHSDGHEWALGSDQSLRFSQQLRQPRETIDVTLTRAITRERERYAYLNSFLSPAANPATDHLYLSMDLVSTEAGLAYVNVPSTGRQLKLGYAFRENNNAFDNSGDRVDAPTGQPVSDPAITNDFLFLQKVHAVYASYGAESGPWALLVGVRAERTLIDSHQITGHIDGMQRYDGTYPSLHLDRRVGSNATVSLSVARRISRPDPEDLNPFSDHQDTHNLRSGNPALRPQETSSLEAGYATEVHSRRWMLTAYLRRMSDSITDITRPVGQDVVLTSKVNLPHNTSTGLDFATNASIGERVSYGISGSLFNSQIDARTLGSAGLASTSGINGKMNVDYHFASGDSAQISASRTDRRLTPQGYLSAINLVNAGYRHQFQPHLSLVMTITDLFNGQNARRVVDAAALNGTYQRHQFGRVAYVGLAWQSGSQKKSNSGEFDYEQ